MRPSYQPPKNTPATLLPVSASLPSHWRMVFLSFCSHQSCPFTSATSSIKLWPWLLTATLSSGTWQPLPQVTVTSTSASLTGLQALKLTLCLTHHLWTSPASLENLTTRIPHNRWTASVNTSILKSQPWAPGTERLQGPHQHLVRCLPAQQAEGRPRDSTHPKGNQASTTLRHFTQALWRLWLASLVNISPISQIQTWRPKESAKLLKGPQPVTQRGRFPNGCVKSCHCFSHHWLPTDEQGGSPILVHHPPRWFPGWLVTPGSAVDGALFKDWTLCRGSEDQAATQGHPGSGPRPNDGGADRGQHSETLPCALGQLLSWGQARASDGIVLIPALPVFCLDIRPLLPIKGLLSVKLYVNTTEGHFHDLCLPESHHASGGRVWADGLSEVHNRAAHERVEESDLCGDRGLSHGVCKSVHDYYTTCTKPRAAELWTAWLCSLLVGG